MTTQEQTWMTYTTSWNQTDATARSAIFQQSLAPTVIYRDPHCQAAGHDQLNAVIDQFHNDFPGGTLKTTSFIFHHGRSLANWELSVGDEVVATGTSYGEYDESDRLTVMNSFYVNPEA